MLNYFAFVIENRRFLAFGLSLAFFASFGQTYFVALFGAEIRATFSLSHGEFGGVYSAATLASAASLVWLGRLIDVVDLRLYSALACAGLALACLLMAGMTSTVVLFVAIYGLRLTGQGIMSHASVTSMARYFDSGRGKALSIALARPFVGQRGLPPRDGIVDRTRGMAWRMGGDRHWTRCPCRAPRAVDAQGPRGAPSPLPATSRRRHATRDRGASRMDAARGVTGRVLLSPPAGGDGAALHHDRVLLSPGSSRPVQGVEPDAGRDRFRCLRGRHGGDLARRWPPGRPLRSPFECCRTS